MTDTLDALGRELILARRPGELDAEEREILEVLMRRRPELRRLARHTRALGELEAKAQTSAPPPGLHAALRARLTTPAREAAPARRARVLPIVALGALTVLLLYTAGTLWTVPGFSYGNLSDLFNSVAGLTGTLWNSINSVSLDASLGWSLTGWTALYGVLLTVGLLGILMEHDLRRQRGWDESAQSFRKDVRP